MVAEGAFLFQKSIPFFGPGQPALLPPPEPSVPVPGDAVIKPISNRPRNDAKRRQPAPRCGQKPHRLQHRFRTRKTFSFIYKNHRVRQDSPPCACLHQPGACSRLQTGESQDMPPVMFQQKGYGGIAQMADAVKQDNGMLIERVHKLFIPGDQPGFLAPASPSSPSG